MSWSGGIQGASPGRSAYVTLRPVAARLADAPAASDPGQVKDIDARRSAARDAYQRGHAQRAADLQAEVLRLGEETGQATVDDTLFLGLALTNVGRQADAVTCLRNGLARYPDHAALHENLAVLLLATGSPTEAIEAAERALALGSDSPNVLDCLTEAHARIGRIDLAVTHGRRALEAKDRKFGSAAPIVRVPSGAVPVFNPNNPDENVIAYCLWGNQPRYHVPLLENARIRAHLFPAWRIRVYHDSTVDPSYLSLLRERGVDLRVMSLPPDVPAHRKLLWRFDVASDPAVRRFLCRDADSLLTVKERVAVDAWLLSDFPFHAMRDWYSHTDLLLAGMWGGVGGILPPVQDLVAAWRGWRVEHDHVDQDLLSETVWPIVRGHVLIHDSVFAPCLGSVPFPPFGHLPPSMHIGQNAFVHFEAAGGSP